MQETMTEVQKNQLLDVNKQAVSCFSLQMVENLNNNIHKGHWAGETNVYLLERLREEMEELELAVMRGADLKTVLSEAADVANFAMMIADNAVRVEELTEQQHILWLELMNEAGITYMLNADSGIDFQSEEDMKEAFQLARQHGLNTITDTPERKLLREIGYSEDDLAGMSDKDCEAEVSHLGD